MTKWKPFLPVLLTGAALLATAWRASAQTDARIGAVAGPDYRSDASSGTMSDANFNSPTSDGRPGVYFFALGVQAFKKGDYKHALAMYKVAASWAYKPAEYNLAVMYFKGQGIPVDRARGAAWMILAAERGAPGYVKAQDLMVTALTDAQFERTDQIWNELKPTYADAVALKRAKAQWRRVGMNRTGSRVGDPSVALVVGTFAPGPPTPSKIAGSNGVVATSPMDLTGGGAVDGSVAYRQFDQSSDPYDPRFNKNGRGSVIVEPLQHVKPGTPAESGDTPSAPPGSTHPNI